jgi:hypothetical protein
MEIRRSLFFCPDKFKGGVQIACHDKLTGGVQSEKSQPHRLLSSASKDDRNTIHIPTTYIFHFYRLWTSLSCTYCRSEAVAKMGSQANGVKHGTFLFTSESVGEGHPDKIA